MAAKRPVEFRVPGWKSEVSSLRLWAMRLLVGPYLLFTMVRNPRFGVVDAPSYSAGALFVTVIFYYVFLKLLAKDPSETQTAG